MGLFLKKEIIYLDALHEWRSTKVHDFQMLDRVGVMKTIRESEYSHPHSPYKREIEHTTEEGIIIGEYVGSIYTDITDEDYIKYDGWEADGKTSRSQLIYAYRKGYRVLLRNGETLDAHTVKKSHGEFQEEIDHMNSIEKKKLEVLAKQEEYKKSLEGMEELLENGRKLQNKMVNKLIGTTFNK